MHGVSYVRKYTQKRLKFPLEVKVLVYCLFYLVSFKSLVAMFLSMITQPRS